MNVQGVVEDIIVREVGGYDSPAYDIIVGGKKYGHGFSKPSFNKNDAIAFEVDVVKKGKYTNYNIRRETVRASVEAAASADTGAYDRNRSIVRQNSLAHATAILVGAGIVNLDSSAEIVIDIARKFEAYSMCEE